MSTDLESRQFDGPQYVIDWMAFERVFLAKEGFAPNPHDSRAQSLFHYFTVGAHEEFVGRLQARCKVLGGTKASCTNYQHGTCPHSCDERTKP